MIVLDASVVIGFLDERDAHHRAAFGVLMADDDYLMHTMTVAEVLVQWVKEDRLAEAEARIAELGVTEQPRLVRESARLARLRADSRLRLPDACVVLVAEERGCPLATFDAHLAATARKRGVTVVSSPTAEAGVAQ